MGRTAIIQTALVLLNEVGLDGLTVRRLAERLGVQNPALYWHFKNKQALLNAMAHALLAQAYADLPLPSDSNGEWEAWVGSVARRLRKALTASRDGTRLITAADLTGSAHLAVFEQAMGVLVAAGFDLRTALVSMITIFDFTVGSAFEEQGEPPSDGDRGAAPGKFADLPLVSTALVEAADRTLHNHMFTFEAGLQLILAGMRAARAGAATQAPEVVPSGEKGGSAL